MYKGATTQMKKLQSYEDKEFIQDYPLSGRA